MCFLLLQWVLLTQDPTGVYQEEFTNNNVSRHPRDQDLSMRVQKWVPHKVQMEPRKPGSFTLFPFPCFSQRVVWEVQGRGILATRGSFVPWSFAREIHCVLTTSWDQCNSFVCAFWDSYKYKSAFSHIYIFLTLFFGTRETLVELEHHL